MLFERFSKAACCLAAMPHVASCLARSRSWGPLWRWRHALFCAWGALTSLVP